jgi:N-alpha-acetyltransferase 35, NatC auxiliary subunit
MDPKMDSGCLEATETIDDDYDVCRTLLPEEVLGIIDQLLCHEVCGQGTPLRGLILTV